MISDAASCFVERQIESLRTIIRIAMEVGSFLRENESGKRSSESFQYTLETVISGVDEFFYLANAYGSLSGSLKSALRWSNIDLNNVESEIAKCFAQFQEDCDFLIRCRQLLDLYKLQLALVAISYDP